MGKNFIIKNLSIHFGGIQALDNVSMEVASGSVHAIIGPNGAGKTTLLNCISRIYTANSGNIIYNDKDITRMKPHRIVDCGISRTFQNVELFKHMSVMDNLLLGCHSVRDTGVVSDMIFWGRSARQEVAFRERAESVIDFLNLQAHRGMTVERLPYGTQKIVELGRALVMEPSLLLLDEPSSGLNVEETNDLSFWIEDIREDFGITVIIVEHDMRLVMDVSDAITALDNGRVIASGASADVIKDPQVVQSYLGVDE